MRKIILFLVVMATVVTSFSQSELRRMVPFVIPIGTTEANAKSIISRHPDISMRSSETKNGIKTIEYRDTWIDAHVLYLSIENGYVTSVDWGYLYSYSEDEAYSMYSAIKTYLEESYGSPDYIDENRRGLSFSWREYSRYYLYYKNENYGAILQYCDARSNSSLLSLFMLAFSDTDGGSGVSIHFCSTTEVRQKIKKIKQKEKEEAEKKRTDEFNALISRARDYSHDGKYEEALQKYQEALSFWPEKSSEYGEEIEKCKQDQALAIERKKQNNFTSLISSAREKRDAGDYTSAITKYNAAIAIYPNRENDYLSEINECRSRYFCKYGDLALDNHQYANARRNYNDALELTTSNTQEIKQKLAQVDRVERLDIERKDTVYNYRLVNATNYQNTKKELSDLVLEYAKKNDINPCTITVVYRHSLRGNETKEISVSPNDYSLKSYLERNVPSLPVHKTFGLILATEAIFQIPVESVKTTTHSAKRNYKEIKTSEPLRTEIMSQMVNPGRYTIGYTTVCIDGTNSSFQKMLTYRNTGGATNTLLSVVVPGLGQHKVTFGEKKGIGTTIGVYGLIAGGIGLYYVSNNEYDKYHATTDQTVMDKTFTYAQISRTASYIALGVAVSWWFYDIIDVYRKGKSNDERYGKGRTFFSYSPQNNSLGIAYTLNF